MCQTSLLFGFRRTTSPPEVSSLTIRSVPSGGSTASNQSFESSGSGNCSREEVLFHKSRRRQGGKGWLVCSTSPVVRLTVVALAITMIVVFLLDRSVQYQMSHRSWVLAPIFDIERTCPKPEYTTLTASAIGRNIAQVNDTSRSMQRIGTDDYNPSSICIATLTDEKQKSAVTKYLGWRNFDGLLALTWDNKQRYAVKHGYRLFDESDQYDKSRPPSWSKILAVQRLLTEERCDWVYWLDADTVVMNSDKRIEDFLPAASSPSKELLLSADKGGGYNAGAWLVHNSQWSLQFLDTWWNMKSHVRPPGLARSGDNDALNALLRDMLEDGQFLAHCAALPRCTFNSYAVFVSPSESARVQKSLKDQSWYNSTEFYHKSDLVAHVPGIDNKRETLEMLLKLAT